MEPGLGGDHRLKSKKTIARLFREGKSIKAYPVIALVIRDETAGLLQLAVSVPKKRIPKAVDRNRIKRQIREAFRINLEKGGLTAQEPLALMLLYVDSSMPEFERLEASAKRIIRKLKESEAPDVEQH